jgi:uncharacterized protein YndB with AHSA1/START domain
MEDLTLKKEIEISAPKEKVWDALVNPEKIKKYLFGTNTKTNWKPGSPVRFTGEYQGQQYDDGGVVLRNEPNKVLEYTYWSAFTDLPETEQNSSIVTYELKDSGNSTLLNVKQQRFKDRHSYEHSGENWENVLKQIKQIVESS